MTENRCTKAQFDYIWGLAAETGRFVGSRNHIWGLSISEASQLIATLKRHQKATKVGSSGREVTVVVNGVAQQVKELTPKELRRRRKRTEFEQRKERGYQEGLAHQLRSWV